MRHVMKALVRSARGGPLGVLLALLVLLLGMPGCLVQRRQRLPPAALTPVLRSATLEQLLEKIRFQQDAIRTLQATLELEPSVRSSRRAEIVQYRGVRAFLLIRKPAWIRMIGLTPVVRSTAFDMASDGEKFELYIPSKNRFIIGDSQGGRRSESALENMRPQHVLDALLLKGPEPGREQAVLEASSDGRNSYYIVHILRTSEGQRLLLARKIWFERRELSPVRLQIFEESGEEVADVRYSNPGEFSGIPFAQKIVMDRPKDQYGLSLTLTKLEFNQPLGEEKFRMEQPAGTERINLEEESLPEREADIG